MHGNYILILVDFWSSANFRGYGKNSMWSNIYCLEPVRALCLSFKIAIYVLYMSVSFLHMSAYWHFHLIGCQINWRQCLLLTIRGWWMKQIDMQRISSIGWQCTFWVNRLGGLIFCWYNYFYEIIIANNCYMTHNIFNQIEKIFYFHIQHKIHIFINHCSKFKCALRQIVPSITRVVAECFSPALQCTKINSLVVYYYFHMNSYVFYANVFWMKVVDIITSN